MNILYNTGIALYNAAAHVAAIKSEKVRTMLAGEKSAIEKIRSTFTNESRPVWFHAASLGEFEQARPMIEKMRREMPEVPVLLSFFSPSGYEIRKNYPQVDCVVYLPMDTESNARRFVEAVNPRLAVFVKYEFWGNYLEQLKLHSIPTAIISAIFRDRQSFFRPYGATFRKMLGAFSAGVYVQDEHSQSLLSGIGVKSVVAGDTRFDRVTEIMSRAQDIAIVRNFTAGAKTVIMGSSWQPDEDIVVEYFNRHPEIKLIIAPHEFDEERLSVLIKKIKRSVKRFSKLSDGDTIDADCLIIDCFGILSSCYRYADIAYIGGGFGVGIHNINEAAVYNMPVIFGPKYDKFKEAHDLIALGGAFSISSAVEFNNIMDKMLCDDAYLQSAGTSAGKYIASQVGATDKIYNQLKQYMK